MASDYGQRGQAAARLMKGKKGPPPEDELGLPPEEGAEAPPPPGGGGMDLSALLGAAGGGGGAPPMGGEPPMDAPPEEMPPMPEEGMEEGGEAQPLDLDTALGSVEGALEGLPPEAAEEIRVHLNAIREIAAGGGAGASPAPVGPGMEPEMGSDAMPPAPADKEAGS